MPTFRVNEVFIPGGLPDITYVPREERELEKRVNEAKDHLCKLVTLTGQTKSGKTVLVSKNFPRDEVVWLDGGSFPEEGSLWAEVNEILGAFTDHQESHKNGSSFDVRGGDSSVSINAGRSRSQSFSGTRSSSPKSTAISTLRSTHIPVVIDDFHYLPRDVQGSVVRGLKSLIADGLPVIIIAIPHRRYDVMKVEREMTGRIENIQIPEWETNELMKIPETGFPSLNIEVDQTVLNKFTHEALGSPHLMQEFCRELCHRLNIEQTSPTAVSFNDVSMVDNIMEGVAESSGRVMFEKLKRGPRQRSDRIQRNLQDGVTTDIYGVVLKALASMNPRVQTIEYEELRTTIRNISAGDPPQAHEVSRVLEQMAKISANDESSTPVIDWNSEERLLHISDPFFAFYLRWGQPDVSIP